MRKVYQYGLRPPTNSASLARAQLRAAHDYANELTAIERGRRWAIRQIDESSPDAIEAAELVRAATKSARKGAVATLSSARKRARLERRCEDGRWAVPEADTEKYPFSPLYETDRIELLARELVRQARAHTPTFWGTYLGIEAGAQQARQAPLYGDDALEPNDPRFVPWRGTEAPAHERPRLPESAAGQLGIQLQGGLSTAEAYACTDTRVRLRRGGGKDGDRRYGVLSLRVGSDGRDPVWAEWPIKLHREIPDAAVWKWVRVSVRHEGRRERWSCEITVDDPSPMARDLDRALSGCIAIEWEWSDTANGIRVARWADDRGESGDVVLPLPIAAGIRKPDGIRAVRDIIDNDFRERLARAIVEAKLPAGHWLLRETATLALWKSPTRLYRLAQRWTDESAPKAKAMLLEWRKRDEHLWDYEACSRGQALRRRREWYRCLAARWARQYRTALLSDQDLSREARWGDDGDRRFTAAPAELRQALRNAFGRDALDGRWARPEEDAAPWCERSRDAWMAGGARKESIYTRRKESTGNAWAAKKAKATTKLVEPGGARDAAGNTAE
jgi:hypothetical protein